MTQTQTHVCPQCGKPTSGALPDRVCPKCLMALAMNDVAMTTSHDASGNSQAHVPSVERLVVEFPELEILHLIGHGGMGAVYQARQLNLDRIVALKILSPRLSRDPAFAERFLREARTLAKLAHPNIVTVFDFGRAGDFYYLTMEFVDGVNLRDTISANLLNPAEALAIVPQVCDALQYAHDHGVVHRDIKPENILIAKNGNIKIADFGLAKLVAPTADQFTLTGTQQVLGTRNYMAPEQIETPNSVDHRADLYSLGVVFYELLTGELPLGRFSLPSEKSASCSAGLDDVVMRTLEKDPGRRFQQASQIKTACASLESMQPAAPKMDNEQEHSTEKREFDENGSPVCQPFPVIIRDIYASLATGFGILRGYESHLELEYEIRDTVVDHKWGADKIRIPLDRIVWLNLHQGMIYTYIDVQADQFETVSKIPNSKQGQFRVFLKRHHRPSAQQLVHYVQNRLADSLASQTNAPMPPIKAARRKYGMAMEKEQSGFVTALLILLVTGACSAVGLLMIAGFFWFWSSAEPTITSTPTATVEVMESVSAPASTIESDAELDAENIAAPTDGGNADVR